MNELLFAARRGHLAVVKTLLASGADVTATNEKGATALAVAAQEGHVEIVKALLAAKASAAAKDKDGRTALFCAAQAGHTEVVKTLLDSKADPAAADRAGTGALWAASEQGHVEVVEALLAVLPKGSGSETGAALLMACGQGRTDVVKALLSAGADAGVKDKAGFTALALACQHGRLDVVSALLAAKADLRAAVPDGRTPLVLAAAGGHTAAVKALLAAGADVRARDAKGWTALTHAASKGCIDVVKELLGAGAKPGAAASGGETALMAAARGGHVETVEALLAAGADPDDADNEKVTALMVASMNGHVEAVQVLLSARARVEARETVGWTALLLAAQNGRNDVVKALVAAKADVAAADDDGVTALMLAAMKGHDHVVKTLLAAGADPAALDKKGRTALAFAAAKNHVEAGRILREAAAAKARPTAPPPPAPSPAPAAPAPAPAPPPPPPPPAPRAPVPVKEPPPAPEPDFDPAARFRRKPSEPIPDAAPTPPPVTASEGPLDRARRLLGKGDVAGASASLTRDAIQRAAAVPDQARLVAAVTVKAGVIEAFVKEHARLDASRDFLSAYGRAFMEAGQAQAAQSFYASIPPLQLTPRDEQDVAELRLRVGDEERAGVLLRRVLQSRPIGENPAWPYSLARLAEELGRPRFAQQVYALFEEKGVQYSDAATRLSRLRQAAQPKPAPAAAPAAAPAGAGGELGKVIAGRYKVVSKIGEGGMGVVYEGYDSNLMRRVAIKRMSDSLRADARARERFMQEATIIARLTHPYILAIHDVVANDDGIYLVFEFVDGRPLTDMLIERGRLTLPEVKRVMAFVCAAIDHAHQHDILHRDLKPANVMVDKQGFVKVMDFGLARVAKDSVKRLTEQEIMGTPAFMAPEYHLGESAPPADVFSLGVMCYEMLTGDLPFNGPDFLAQKERRKYVPPCQLVKELPAGLDPLIAAVLDPDPLKRPKAKEFLARLQAL